MTNDHEHELTTMAEYLRLRPALVRRCLALGGDIDAILAMTARAMAEVQYPTLRRDPGYRRWCAERKTATDTWDISA